MWYVQREIPNFPSQRESFVSKWLCIDPSYVSVHMMSSIIGSIISIVNTNASLPKSDCNYLVSCSYIKFSQIQYINDIRKYIGKNIASLLNKGSYNLPVHVCCRNHLWETLSRIRVWSGCSQDAGLTLKQINSLSAPRQKTMEWKTIDEKQ